MGSATRDRTQNHRNSTHFIRSTDSNVTSANTTGKPPTKVPPLLRLNSLNSDSTLLVCLGQVNMAVGGKPFKFLCLLSQTFIGGFRAGK